MSNWYDKYVGIPFKHLGDDLEGIDCFNLCRLVLRQERGLSIFKPSSHFCNIVDDHWYNKTSISPFEQAVKEKVAIGECKKVEIPSKFDIVVMSIGATNITNHCALYVGNSKLLQVTTQRNSWISSYGNYYKQYTTGIYRCINLKS